MEFRVLGPLEVESGGCLVPIKGAKERALLVSLLLHANRLVSRDLLIDELWGEHPPATAKHTLEAHVSHLRRALASAGNGALLESRPGGYRICVEDDQLDKVRFERLLEEGRSALASRAPAEAEEKLAAALALWRGPALADLAFEPFAEAEARRLEELRLAGVETGVEAALALGRDAELVGELQALVAAHPLRERVRALLMLALYRAGRQADALAVYRDGRRRLVEELGIEPGRELQELERAILRQEPQLQPPAPAAEAVPAAPARPPHRPGLSRSALLALAAAGAAIVVVAAVVVLWPRGGAGGVRITRDGVAWIDPSGGRVVRASVTSTDSAPRGIAAGGGGVWTLDAVEGLALRLDPRSGAVVQTLRVGTDAGGVAVGGGSAWVTSTSEASVRRISLQTNEPVQRISVGNSPTGIAYGLGSVWVAAAGERRVARLDARTGRREAQVPTGLPGTGVAVGAGYVWATHTSAGSVSQIDPQTNEVVRTIPVGNGPTAIAVPGGAVWVANWLDGTVSRIDPRTGTVTATVRVGRGPVGIVGVGDSVWVANEASATLVAVDTTTARPIRTLQLGAEPRGLAAAGGLLAVPVRATFGDHRGGVLRVAKLGAWLDSIDPALAYTVDAWEVLSLTNDGLVSFRRVGGPEGATLVPDLAETLPSATASRITYTFRLRPQLRYSTGERVRAADVRRSLERLFRLDSPRLDFYAGLVGGAACIARPARCDLSRGVRTDDAGRTVTFHLARPDPEFLYKLALPFASVLPPSTPMRPAGVRPLAATGPYVLRRYRRAGKSVSFELARNPLFRPSSSRPDGYPDRIVFRSFAASDRGRGRALRLVELGRLDVADLFLRKNLAQLRARYASRVHLVQLPATFFLVLNPRLPPFDRLAVRRALSYAVDRRAARNSPMEEPTCQMLPPSVPAYRPYCPYTLGSGPAWRDPDLRRARELVADTGTRGMHVTVWMAEEMAAGDRALVATVRALRRLGYRADSHVVPYETLHAQRRRSQAAVSGWNADYPAPSNFFSALRCQTGEALSCAPGLERAITHLTALQATDPARADTDWTTLDRQVVDNALAVPLFNLRGYKLVSDRVRNYQNHIVYSALLDQMRVR